MNTILDLSLVFDVAIVLLLIAAIGYCLRLSRRLAVLRQTKDEMVAMVADFSVATEKAQRGLEALKSLAGRSGEELQARVAKADQLSRDLAFLVERAEGACDRLEEAIGRSRQQAAPGRLQTAVASRAGAFHKPCAATAPAGTTRGGAPAQAAQAAEAARPLSASQAGLLKALQGLR